MSNKSITLDFLEYLKDDLQVYQHYDTTTVSAIKGKQIADLDINEDYVHVEFLENVEGKEVAIVWDKKRWKESYELTERQRIVSDKRRQQYYLDDENIAIVSKALARVTGITHAELLKPLAVEIIKNRKFDSLPCLNLSDLRVKVE